MLQFRLNQQLKYMKNIYPVFILSLFICSCSAVSFSYVGSSYIPTKNVDVYVDEAAINRAYTIIGKGYPEPTWRGVKPKQEKILTMAIAKARKNGADAIFFKEVFIPSPSTNIQTFSQIDSVNRGLATRSTTTISPSYGFFHQELLFLKYQ
jgi:hypothetical protein